MGGDEKNDLPIYSVDAGALVVSSEQEKVLRVFDLVGKQQADGLQRLLSSVDVIAQKEVVRLWGKAAVLEQTQQIIILSVDVTCRVGGREREERKENDYSACNHKRCHYLTAVT